MFWFVALSLLGLVGAAMLWPLMRGGASLVPRAEHDVEVYGAQLRELQGDLQRGAIAPDQAASARAEIARRLLKASAEATNAAARAAPAGKRAAAAAVVSVAVLAAGTVGLYSALGMPGAPDLPLEARLAVDPAKADVATLVAQAERRLRDDPNDGAGWEKLLPIYLRMGRAADAATAADNVIRLLGSTAAREATRGEAHTLAADGEVTPAARDAFRTALRLDPENPAALFYLALGLSQDGRFAEAAPAWKSILDKGPPDAPWMAASRTAYDDASRGLAEAAAPAVPGPARGPFPDQVAAAAELSAEDRSAMVAGMVSQLASRLKSAPNDPDGWKRLMRSYTVLGQAAEARDALRQAQAVFSDGTPARRSIDDFAAGLGLGGTGTTP